MSKFLLCTRFHSTPRFFVRLWNAQSTKVNAIVNYEFGLDKQKYFPSFVFVVEFLLWLNKMLCRNYSLDILRIQKKKSLLRAIKLEMLVIDPLVAVCAVRGSSHRHLFRRHSPSKFWKPITILFCTPLNFHWSNWNFRTINQRSNKRLENLVGIL